MAHYDFIIINGKNEPFNLAKYKAALAKRKLDMSKFQCAKVNTQHVTRYKSWGTTAGRDFVVRIDWNTPNAEEALHKPLAGALQETHPSMRLSPRLKMTA